ncbi:MAG: FecR family protein [Draconibacterium sp.]
METNQPKSFQDFISNSGFIKWVKNPDAESDLYWQHFLRNNLSVKDDFEKAKYVIETLQKHRKPVDEENVREIWNNIQSELNQRSGKIKLFNGWTIAATLILVVGLASLFYLRKDKEPVNYSQLAFDDTSIKEVTLILSNGEKKEFHTQEPSFSYSKTGTIAVDSSVNLKDPHFNSKKASDKFNQLMVPFGKRSKLLLSDGSEIVLNSGSHIIFPVHFDGNERELYLEGEAYFSVSHDSAHPFYVKTGQLTVKVLGTEFNVNAYSGENNCGIVLVNGKVEAQVNETKIALANNERLVFDKSSGQVKRETVKVDEFVSWKDGWMYCNNEPMVQIAKKLSRHYDLNISFQDKNAEKLTMTGKLDLRSEDYREVLDVICFSAPVQYSEENGDIILKSK